MVSGPRLRVDSDAAHWHLVCYLWVLLVSVEYAVLWALNKEQESPMARKKFQWSRDDDDPEGESHFTERSSWSEQDKEKKRFVTLARHLVRLTPRKLNELSLSEELVAVVNEAKRLRAKGVKGAMRRQMLLVANVLRQQDPEALALLFENTGA